MQSASAEKLFHPRIDEDEISGDRFPGPLACTSAGETDQISCNGDGVMLSYVSSNGEYILTMFGKGPVVLETGQYSWLANGCVRQVLQNWRS
ncbi:hypothetical protein GGD56_006143 [Rhizobium mongolense]|uniref:Uncharacterized protein n=2 Tax=Rhizobium mongolense TaxID=57676 RepID=A0ABR6IXI6_9HYPH|nr:hypothetical protein [Rhizobium mongolense]TVZ63036.1 hypothetical protein BCL32_3149 [Rhizobium mongolense USDA 1844]